MTLLGCRVMPEPLAEKPPQLVDVRRQCRIAVGVDDASGRDTVVSLLTVGGLPVNAGARPLREIGLVAADPPDAVVLVSSRVDAGVLAALRRVRQHQSVTRIVVVAAGGDPTSQQARQALNAGADAFVPRSEADPALAAAVRAVLAGLVCVPHEARRVLAKPTFSHREKEVLGLLVAGLTNRQIASRLFLAESTVKTHLMSAFAKLGVRSRKDAVALLLDPAEGLAAVSLAPAPR
jgi:DNA-binding NarL/FixJ family response regulator